MINIVKLLWSTPQIRAGRSGPALSLKREPRLWIPDPTSGSGARQDWIETLTHCGERAVDGLQRDRQAYIASYPLVAGVPFRSGAFDRSRKDAASSVGLLGDRLHGEGGIEFVRGGDEYQVDEVAVPSRWLAGGPVAVVHRTDFVGYLVREWIEDEGR